MPTDLSPLRAKILRFLVGIKKSYFSNHYDIAPPRKLGGPRWLRVPPLAGCAWRARPYGGSVVRQHGKPRSSKRSHADPAGADQAQARPWSVKGATRWKAACLPGDGPPRGNRPARPWRASPPRAASRQGSGLWRVARVLPPLRLALVAVSAPPASRARVAANVCGVTRTATCPSG